jgi:hypothetical protein
MPLEFRDLLIESIRVQEQWLDLGERLHTGTPGIAGEEAFREMGERREVLFRRIAEELPAELIEFKHDLPVFAFTQGEVLVEPRATFGERLVEWLRTHPAAMQSLLSATATV